MNNISIKKSFTKNTSTSQKPVNKIPHAFENGKAFIPFITCGDPCLDITKQLTYAMEDAGADLIELGIPFSDPTAEGPVIQQASIRALGSGTTTDKIFDMTADIRSHTQIPMVYMTYANVVFLRNGTLCRKSCPAGNGWADPARHPI